MDLGVYVKNWMTFENIEQLKVTKDNFTKLSQYQITFSLYQINSSLANGDKSPSDKICQTHTQSSQQACPT